MFSTFRADAPQLFVDLNRQLAKSKGVDVADIFQVLSANFGSYYVNDFNKFGRVYRVYVQAEGEARAEPADIGQVYVRNKEGAMIPLNAFVTVRPIQGPLGVRAAQCHTGHSCGHRHITRYHAAPRQRKLCAKYTVTPT